jgi:hypothetical protein
MLRAPRLWGVLRHARIGFALVLLLAGLFVLPVPVAHAAHAPQVQPALSVTLTVNHNPATVGQSIKFTTAASGGVPPYSYWYTSLPPGCASQNLSQFTCSATQVGTYPVMVQVNDSSAPPTSNNAVLTPALQVTSPTPSVTSFSLNRTSVGPGGSFESMVTISGGATPYSLTLQGYPSGCSAPGPSSAATIDFNCTLPSGASGSYTVSVRVTDGNGNSATSSPQTLTVTASTISILSFTASPNSIRTGSTFTSTVQVSGGTPPYSISLNGYPSNCVAPPSSSSTTITFTCTPSNSGNYPLSVRVTDSTGASATSNTQTVNVQSSNGGGGNNGTGGNNNSGGSFNPLSGLGGTLQTLFLFFLVFFGLFVVLVGALVATAIFTGLTARRTRRMLLALEAQNVARGVTTTAAVASGPATLPARTTCPSCGVKNDTDAKFCQGCGKTMTPATTEAKSEETKSDAKV